MRKSFKKIVACALAAALSIAVPVSTEGIGTVHAESLRTTLALNTEYVQGNIAASNEHNYYTLSLPSAGFLTIKYQGRGIEESGFSLEDSDLQREYTYSTVRSSEGATGTTSKTIAMEKGQYVIEVYGKWGATGKYALKAEFTAAGNNEAEPNNYYDKAMDLPANKLITGFLSADDRLDYYRVVAPRDMTIRIIVTSKMDDTKLTIWTKDYELVEWYQISGTVNAPGTRSIDVNIKAGNNYLGIQPRWGNETGIYQLQWQEAPTPVTGVLVNGDTAVEVGKAIQLSAVVTPDNATNKTVNWTSDNTNIAVVNEKGLVTGVSEGETTIRAAAVDGSEKYGEIRITVKKVEETTQPSGNTSSEQVSNEVQQISKVKTKANGKKKVTVSWAKQPNASKYEVQISTNKKFNKNLMVKVVNNKNKLKVKYKKSGKAYVRVRAIDKNGYVGSWSSVKKVKIKK